MVGAVGLEPTIPKAKDFKSSAYADSATLPHASCQTKGHDSKGGPCLSRHAEVCTNLAKAARGVQDDAEQQIGFAYAERARTEHIHHGGEDHEP